MRSYLLLTVCLILVQTYSALNAPVDDEQSSIDAQSGRLEAVESSTDGSDNEEYPTEEEQEREEILILLESGEIRDHYREEFGQLTNYIDDPRTFWYLYKTFINHNYHAYDSDLDPIYDALIGLGEEKKLNEDFKADLYAICRDDMNKKHKIAAFPCGHDFHAHCGRLYFRQVS